MLLLLLLLLLLFVLLLIGFLLPPASFLVLLETILPSRQVAFHLVYPVDHPPRPSTDELVPTLNLHCAYLHLEYTCS